MGTRATLGGLLAAAVLAAAAPSAAIAQDCPGADAPPSQQGVEGARAAVRCLLNVARADQGLGALAAQGQLKAAADPYAARMVAEQFFSHESPDGGTLLDRLRASHYVTKSLKRFSVAENLAYGTGELASPQEIVNGWLNSSKHRANMLNKDFKDVGIGIAAGSPFGDDDAWTFVADFGMRVVRKASKR